MTNGPPASSGRPARSGDAGRACPYCRFAIKAGTPVVICEFCRAPHHQDCWSDNGGCSVMGCAGGPSPGGGSAAAVPVAPPTQVMAPPPARPPAAPPPPVQPASGDEARKPATALIVACAIALLAAGAAVATVLTTRTSERSAANNTTVTVVSSPPTPPPSATSPVVAPTATTPVVAPPTTTATAPETTTVTTTVPAAPDGLGPSEVIREHFTRLDAGEYDAAFALFTPKFQQDVRRWVTARGREHPHVNIDYVLPAISISAAFARVPTKIYIRDEIGKYPYTACQRYEGELPVEKVDGEWRYGPTGHDWKGVVMDSANPNCP